MLKTITLLVIFFFELCTEIKANTLKWDDMSSIETGFAIEMLFGGVWKEVARVGANVTTYVDTNTEGVYRVRALVSSPGQPDVFSGYSNVGIRIAGPMNEAALSPTDDPIDCIEVQSVHRPKKGFGADESHCRRDLSHAIGSR